MIAKLFYNLVDGLIRGMARLSTDSKSESKPTVRTMASGWWIIPYIYGK
jgi:hypothetical protein